MSTTVTTSSTTNIFSHYTKPGGKCDHARLKKAVHSGKVGNIDYSNYKIFRAFCKSCATKYFPELFVVDTKLKKKQILT